MIQAEMQRETDAEVSLSLNSAQALNLLTQ